jgi:CSLREA domain-containing protein
MEERRGMSRAKKVATAAGGLFAAAAVIAPAANAASFEVNSLADNGDGNCKAVADGGDGICTLRDAITEANEHVNSPTGTPDEVNFAANVRGTIDLTGGPGSSTLQIVHDGVHINGPGADQLTVAGSTDRIFKLFGFGTTPQDDYDVTISGLTLTDGAASDSFSEGGSGGAILSANNGFYAWDETFLCGSFAALTVKDVNITGNDTPDNGGGIAVERSSCRDKAAPSTEEGALNVINSTLSDNSAGFEGGGIAMEQGSGSLFVSNSTIAGNTSDGPGGGIAVDTRVPVKVAPVFTYDVDNTTINGNTTGDGGGGIFTTEDMGLRSTIVFGNQADPPQVSSKAPTADDILAISGGSFTAGYSLIGTRTGGTVTDTPGEPNLSSDPQLGTLQNNGGTTPTELPATTSPAIDTGISNGLSTDQRGLPRTVDRQPDNAADGTDIGAVEVPADPPVPTPEPQPEPQPLPGPTTQECLGKQVILTKGTDANETLTGTGVDDGILGSGGVDTIEGLSGDDCLFGQVGNDLVEGGPGDDNANGDRDNDTVNGDDGADSVRGQNGNDKVNGGEGNDPKVTGGAGDDKVKGGPGDDFVKGDGGNDVLDLGSGQDFAHSGGGADEIFAADGEKDKIICGTGKDVAHVDPKDDVDKDCNTVDVVH